MKLFNTTIDNKLFKQYSFGSDLSKQKVVAKIFNPYGRGTWYIVNSDPQDPDYLWAIVDLGYGAEVGSVSRSDLENYRNRMGWGFERDLSFDPINAEELLKGLRKGETFSDGGAIYKRGGETPKYLHNLMFDSDGNRKTDDKTIKKLTEYVNKLPQTKTFHIDKKTGDYTKSRLELHKQIIDEYKDELVCIQKKEPIAILMGGSPASGKSTFLRKYAPYLLKEEILKIDADDIRSKLPEYKGYNASQTQAETKDIVNTLLSDRTIGIPCKYDIIYDGTMNNTKSYIPLIDLLKKLDYKIYIVYIDNVPEEVVKRRALERYKKSGRFVPMEVIDDFFSKGKTALYQLEDKVDGYMIIDGSNSDYKIIEKHGMSLPKTRLYSKLGTPISQLEAEKNKFDEGGHITFKRKAKAIADKFEGKAVAPKYQDEYGKTYDREEAQEVGNKIAGAMRAKGMDKKAFGGFFGKAKESMSKSNYPNLDNTEVRLKNGEYVQVLDQSGGKLYVMELSKLGTGAVPKYVDISQVEDSYFMGGGKVSKAKKSTAKKQSSNTNRGGAMQLAKQIRKEGEKWTDALKRANAQLRK